MGNNRRFDQQYIVNLTTQLIGASLLAKLAASGSSDPDALNFYCGARISEKLKKMNPETLGLICSFGYSRNFNAPLARTTGFIRMTGLAEVHPKEFKPTTGRQLLEEIALWTIIAVATDIIWQDGYEARRAEETAEEELFDRGMAEYVHHGSSARQLR